MATNPRLQFKNGIYTADKFSNAVDAATQKPISPITHEEGTIYLAIPDKLNTAYLFYDDGKVFRPIMPDMLSTENGGTGTNLRDTVEPFSILMQNSSQTAITGIEPKKGAFYAVTASEAPKFATLPVGMGGTGLSSVAAGSLLYGQGADSSVDGGQKALSALAIGTKGYLVGSNGSVPKYLNLSIGWSAGTTAGPTLNLYVKDGSTNMASYTAKIPSASASASGIVTTGAQSFAGEKTFSNSIIVTQFSELKGKVYAELTDDAYYNNAEDSKTGSIIASGGMTVTKNMRVDGGTIQFKQEAKIQYDSTKDCFNFVF